MTDYFTFYILLPFIAAAIGVVFGFLLSVTHWFSPKSHMFSEQYNLTC
jgi:hypothetical protein